MDSATPIQLLLNRAEAFGVKPTGQRPEELDFTVESLMPDGQAIVFNITVAVKGLSLEARETRPFRLPTFCPQRHINRGGTFCMNWQDADTLEVADVEGADRWWGALMQFLRLQVRAARLRAWPNSREWSHGGAARYQRRAENFAGLLGSKFTDVLLARRLSVGKPRHGAGRGRSSKLLLDGHRLSAVWIDRASIVNSKQACICGTNPRRLKQIRCCEGHADAVVELVIALHNQATAEQKFWDACSGFVCCGTIASCPLAKPTQERLS